MSTIVYQKLKPCYESSNFVESRRLKFKFNNAPITVAESHNNDHLSKPQIETSNMFGWSGGIAAPTHTQPEYIHPLVKHSSSKLSQRSLEMCTESLGCETGSCIMENSVFYDTTLFNGTRKPWPKFETRKQSIKQIINPLPPPLTTLTGPNSIQVRSVIIEDGRLVINAVSTPAKRPCLQAERSNGRLKLSLINDYETLSQDHNERDNSLTNDNDNHYDNQQCEETIVIKVKEEQEEGEFG
ncbi:hypothetical protein vseg_014978 [Gypsophila vaccaria]